MSYSVGRLRKIQTKALCITVDTFIYWRSEIICWPIATSIKVSLIQQKVEIEQKKH